MVYPHSGHGHPAGDGLVKDPTEQRWVVWETEQMALSVCDVGQPSSAHQSAQVSLADLGAS